MHEANRDSFLALLQVLLVLSVMLIGFALMVRGMPVIGGVASVVLRGLVIITVLAILYLVVSQRLAEFWQRRGWQSSVRSSCSRFGET